jgi:hypothetical protein
MINLDGLELIDMQGAISFRELTFKISGGGGICRAYGATEKVRQTLGLLGADGYVTFFNEEKAAFDGGSPIS